MRRGQTLNRKNVTSQSQSEGYSGALVLFCSKQPEFGGDKAARCSCEVPD